MINPQLIGSITLLINPASGNADSVLISKLQRRLESPDRRIQTIYSSSKCGIEQIARVVDTDYLFVAGGDGSINRAVTGLLSRDGNKPILGIIPHGTVNVLAHEIGISNDIDELFNMLINHRIKRLYVARANGHPFVLMASSGLDAEVVHRVRLPLKRKIGAFAYILWAARLAFQQRQTLVIETDAERFFAELAIITKTKTYGGSYVIASDANPFRPGLQMITLEKTNLFSLFLIARYMLFGKLVDSRLIKVRSIDRASIRSKHPAATQVDGDPLGFTPLIVQDSKEVINVIVP